MLLSARMSAVAAALASLLIAATSAAAAGPHFPTGPGGPHHRGVPTPGYWPGSDWFGPFSGTFGSLGSALLDSTPTGAGPAEVAIDPATHTLYVTNGYNDNGPNAGGNTLSVIDTRRCQAQDLSHCRGPWPTITVGNLPSSVAVDVASDTVYVTNNGDNTVSVFNGATCNALNTSGCGQKPATVPVGLQPIGLAIDDANHTVYVPDSDNGSGVSTSVSMLNSATCNASDLAGCPSTAPPTVDVGSPPFDAVVDELTHTVYVGTLAATSVFDANTCNATVQSGCGTIGTLNGDSFSGPNGFGIDDANDTLYTANYDNTISAWDMQDCNASDLAGCATATAGTVMPFPYTTNEHALYVAVDAPLHSVYVTYQFDGALIVFDANRCDASDLAGCATLTPSASSTGDEPEGVVLDPQTQTLYAANTADANVSVIDATRCNAQVTYGCRQDPPVVPVAAGSGIAAAPAVNTAYVVPAAGNVLSMINTRVCNSHATGGCGQTPPQVTAGENPISVAVDALTHTVYVANFGPLTPGVPGTVSVINSSTCNATASGGCASVRTLQVPGGNPDGIEVDAATDTIYVATTTDSGPNLLSVFNGATCNATTAAGCNQIPATLAVGDSGGAFASSTLNIAVNEVTNTIYATNDAVVGDDVAGDSIYVINGATCDATRHSGCGQTPQTITGTPVPWGVAVDEATDTVYVANWENEGAPGTVSVINGATCNGSNISGCGQTPQTVAAGFGDIHLAIDPTTNAVYTTNVLDASLSVINGALCNGLVSLGCNLVPPKLAAGDYPSTIAVDPAVATAYVETIEGVSVIPLVP